MAAILFLLTILGVFLLYRWLVSPKQLENGEWRVIDHSDGTLRAVLALFYLLIGTQFAIGLGRGLLQELPKSPREAGIGLLLGLILYGWLLWAQGRKVYEALHAAPGELHVANWPLAAGEFVEVTYQRRLHRGIPAGDVKAKLVHYEVTHGHSSGGSHGSKRQSIVNLVPLEEGEADYTDKLLTATWRFQVPNAMGNPLASLQRSFFELMSNRHRDDEWWALEVELPLRGGTVVDSSFRLKIDYIEGRTQFHLGA
ncbi:hypothetical protein D3C72_1055410 [compost metagenome]